jgi:hypothetical protein
MQACIHYQGHWKKGGGTTENQDFFGPLKGLSHEMDFHNVDENRKILALLSAAAGF